MEAILSWERGEAAPTYVQLEKLAYEVYKRPIAIFFFPEPPDEPDAEESFRTLPELELDKLSADTLYRVRRARAFQESLRELNDGANPSALRIFDDVRLSPTQAVAEAAVRVRSFLDIDFDEQKSWNDPGTALKRWREALENAGIFVFKDSFREKAVSGFCLLDSEFPVIYVNNSTPHTRQIFTLFHELAHILLSTGGITIIDDSYVSILEGQNKKIEVFCNAFAAEILVPMDDFTAVSSKMGVVGDSLSDLARLYSVSREVILRRFLDLGRVTRAEYRTRVEQWHESYEERKAANRGGGGNYYATRATYLGKKYLELAFSRFYKGELSREQLAGHLDVKAGNLASLEDFALS